MKAASARTLSLLLACLGAVLAIALITVFWETGAAPKLPLGQEPADYVDYYLVNPRARQFDPQGKLQHQLSADHYEHYARADVGRFREPSVISRGEDNQSWITTARAGLSEANNRRIELTGNVKIVDNTGASELRTARLWLFPRRDYAETDSAVTMISPTGQTKSLGMEAYLNEDRIVLLSNVRGNYDPR